MNPRFALLASGSRTILICCAHGHWVVPELLPRRAGVQVLTNSKDADL
jgi:hypothetical protein